MVRGQSQHMPPGFLDGEGVNRAIKLSDLDRAILAEVTTDPFASNALVAKTLGVSTSVVSGRLRVLHRENVSQVLAVLDMDRMNQTFCFVYVQTSGRPITEIAEEIATSRLTLMISELSNNEADLLVLVRFQDVHSLNASLYKDMSRVRGIKSWKIDVVVDVPIFRSEYVTVGPQYLPISIEKNIEYLKQDIPEGLCDEIDMHIIANLQKNAHQSINNIARGLGIKPSTARYRINNMKNSDILRFIRVVDHSAAGIDSFSVLQIDADIDKIDEIVEGLRGKEWLPQLFRCAGTVPLVGIILSGHIDEVLRIKREEIMTISGVRSASISSLNRMFKSDFRWAQSTR